MRHLEPSAHRARARTVAGALVLLAASLSLARAQAAHAIACGDRIPAGSKTVLTTDLGPCTGAAALEIEGPATLDLGGHTITCSSAAPVTGIRVIGRGVKVAGGAIERCQVGVSLSGSRHRVSDLEIDLAGSAGIASTGVETVRIENVDIDRPGNGAGASVGAGVRLTASDQRVTLRDVRVFGSSRDGFVVRGERNRLEGCLAMFMKRAGYDVAGRRHVIVESKALQNLLSDPEIVADGFLVSSASQIQLLRNEAIQNNGSGYRIVQSDTVKLDRNLARKNGADGFFVAGGDGVHLRRGTATDNGGNGIRVASSAVGVVVVDNEASGHELPGFDLRSDDPFCRETRWARNDFSSASASCVQ